MYIIITLTLLLLISISFSIFLYINNLKIKNNYENLKKKETLFKNNINDNILNLDLKDGFYDDIIKLSTDKNSSETDDYNLRIYVKELERYKNGYSKIKLINSDVIQGYSTDRYSTVKNIISKKFKTIVKTKDITWLEIDNDINELRKEKLIRLLKKLEIDND